MNRIFILLLLLTTLHAPAQSLFALEKNGGNIKTYSEGMSLTIETIYHQWFDGVITAIRHDSVFINGFPFHYHEIATIKRDRGKLNYEADGVVLMAAGAGVLLLGAVNGLYRGDKAGTWYSTSSFVVAGAMIVGGYLLSRARYKYYHIGKKYTLDFISLDFDKKK
jgi:hypothetical protein